MSSERLQGLAAADALFGQLPSAAKDQLGVELAIIAREILAEQQRAVPKDTGTLEGGLSIALQVDKLRVRIGLLTGMTGGGSFNGKRRARSYGSYYYGRFVNFGRHAQTILVTRRGRQQARGLKSRAARKAAVLAAAYPMKVTALPAREFIQVPGAEALALGQLAEFWTDVLARAGGS